MRWMRPDRRELLQRVTLLAHMRLAKHGPPPDDSGVWWKQLQAIAAENNIAMPTIEQWHEARDHDAWERPL